MDDGYIKRADVMPAIQEAIELQGSDYAEATLAIDEIPAADVRPVMRARWEYEKPNAANSFRGCWWCSNCHQPEYRRNKPYCASCGATMDADMREAK